MGDYNSLVADIKAYMDNDSDEFVAAIDGFVATAHEALNRDVVVQAQDTLQAGVLQVGQPLLPRPSDMIQPRFFRVKPVGGGPARTLRLMDYGFLREFWPDDTQVAMPKYYGVADASNWLLAATPDQAYPYELAYKQYLPVVSATSPTNWYTLHAYAALRAGCLCQASRFVLDDRQASLVSLWEAEYKQLVDGLNAQDIRAERDDYAVPGVDGDNR